MVYRPSCRPAVVSIQTLAGIAHVKRVDTLLVVGLLATITSSTPRTLICPCSDPALTPIGPDPLRDFVPTIGRRQGTDIVRLGATGELLGGHRRLPPSDPRGHERAVRVAGVRPVPTPLDPPNDLRYPPNVLRYPPNVHR
eukprot:152724-Prorocentrum_minimum.AAC.4